MPQVLEINQIDQLAQLRQKWGVLLRQTTGASFFQSLEWLEVYWRHFGAGQRLRVLVVLDEERPTGILPLVVRRETTKLGPAPRAHLPVARLGFLLRTHRSRSRTERLPPGWNTSVARRRDWDIFELRWQGAPGTDPAMVQQRHARRRFSGLSRPFGIAPRSSISTAPGSRTGRRARRRGCGDSATPSTNSPKQGEISYVRYRPLGRPHDDGSPRWDLYDACEAIARRSWQGAATDGTTLSHETVRGFLREAHEARPRRAPSI